MSIDRRLRINNSADQYWQRTISSAIHIYENLSKDDKTALLEFTEKKYIEGEEQIKSPLNRQSWTQDESMQKEVVNVAMCSLVIQRWMESNSLNDKIGLLKIMSGKSNAPLLILRHLADPSSIKRIWADLWQIFELKSKEASTVHDYLSKDYIEGFKAFKKRFKTETDYFRLWQDHSLGFFPYELGKVQSAALHFLIYLKPESALKILEKVEDSFVQYAIVSYPIIQDDRDILLEIAKLKSPRLSALGLINYFQNLQSLTEIFNRYAQQRISKALQRKNFEEINRIIDYKKLRENGLRAEINRSLKIIFNMPAGQMATSLIWLFEFHPPRSRRFYLAEIYQLGELIEKSIDEELREMADKIVLSSNRLIQSHNLYALGTIALCLATTDRVDSYKAVEVVWQRIYNIYQVHLRGEGEDSNLGLGYDYQNRFTDGFIRGLIAKMLVDQSNQELLNLLKTINNIFQPLYVRWASKIDNIYNANKRLVHGLLTTIVCLEYNKGKFLDQETLKCWQNLFFRKLSEWAWEEEELLSTILYYIGEIAKVNHSLKDLIVSSIIPNLQNTHQILGLLGEMDDEVDAGLRNTLEEKIKQFWEYDLSLLQAPQFDAIFWKLLKLNVNSDLTEKIIKIAYQRFPSQGEFYQCFIQKISKLTSHPKKQVDWAQFLIEPRPLELPISWNAYFEFIENLAKKRLAVDTAKTFGFLKMCY